MDSPDASAASFDLLGELDAPASPVVLSVPHAGRDYPLALRANLRGSAAALEDRHIDVVALAARGREVTLVQRRARAWIDLNRAEDERDPRIDEGAGAGSRSARVANGLGLVPRRGAGGELWRRPWSAPEVEARIAADHRPYHLTLARVLAGARARWGVAVLVDLHSMPPLTGAAKGVNVVLGDRFGRSAGPRFVARAEEVARGSRWPAALNTPYAGGHVLERHGRPLAGIHAIQVELDRSLYLDRLLDRPGPGVPRAAAFVRDLLAALADEALAGRQALAAE